jgi:hypothetical protein
VRCKKEDGGFQFDKQRCVWLVFDNGGVVDSKTQFNLRVPLPTIQQSLLVIEVFHTSNFASVPSPNQLCVSPRHNKMSIQIPVLPAVHDEFHFIPTGDMLPFYGMC